MTLEDLAIARDWAVIILAVQAIVVAAVVAFIAWQAYRGVRRARPQVARGLQRARHTVVHVSQRARQGVQVAARPLVEVSSVGAGIRAGWAAWWRGHLRRR